MRRGKVFTLTVCSFTSESVMSHNQYRLESIDMGDASACAWRLGRADLQADPMVVEVFELVYQRVPVQPSRKGGRRFPVSLLLLDAVCYDEQLLLRDTHPQRAPCREKDESVLSLYIAIYRPNL